MNAVEKDLIIALTISMFELVPSSSLYTELIEIFENNNEDIYSLAEYLSKTKLFKDKTLSLKDNEDIANYLILNFTIPEEAEKVVKDYYIQELHKGNTIDKLIVDTLLYLNDNTRRKSIFDETKEVLDKKIKLAKNFIDSGYEPKDLLDLDINKLYYFSSSFEESVSKENLGVANLVIDDYIIKALDSGQKWEMATITYSFNKQASDYYTSEEKSTFEVFNSKEKELTREVFNKLSDVLNVDFKEVNSNGDIKLNIVDTGKWGGYATYPGDMERAGDVFISNKFHTGEYDFAFFKTILMHEVGHALGLKHPFEGDYTLSKSEDSDKYTLMSYTLREEIYIPEYHKKGNSCEITYNIADTDFYSLYDIGVLQSIYGINQQNQENNIYSFDFTDYKFVTIVDSGGEDTLDLSNNKGSDIIDLNSGTINSADIYSANDIFNLMKDDIYNSQCKDWAKGVIESNYNKNLYYSGKDNLTISYGTIIENLYTGSGDDIVYDNEVNNIIKTNSGNDIIYIGRGGYDIIDGGEGEDSLYVLEDIEKVELYSKDDKAYLFSDSFKIELTGIENIYALNGNNEWVDI